MSRMNLSHAVINHAINGNNTIIAAIPDRRIAVFHYLLMSSAVLNATWKSGSSEISGALPLEAKGGVKDSSESPIFITGVNEALVIATDAAGTLSGYVKYEVI
jgi:hypothetical protein